DRSARSDLCSCRFCREASLGWGLVERFPDCGASRVEPSGRLLEKEIAVATISKAMFPDPVEKNWITGVDFSADAGYHDNPPTCIIYAFYQGVKIYICKASPELGAMVVIATGSGMTVRLDWVVDEFPKVTAQGGEFLAPTGWPMHTAITFYKGATNTTTGM